MYWERLCEVETIITPRRTVAVADVLTFLGMSGLFEEVFLVQEETGASDNTRLVPGMVTLSLSEGLLSMTGAVSEGVALLGFRSVEYLEPVRTGDTLKASIRVVESRVSRSRPAIGFVELKHRVDVSGKVVAEYVSQRLIRRRPDS